MVSEWRKTCERVFSSLAGECSVAGFGNGVTMVLSDSRCNQHLTASGCVERPVRLPVAIKAAKQAGAGAGIEVQLDQFVDDKYMTLAEEKVLEKAHGAPYLKRMHAICAGLPPDKIGAPLTEESDGEGGGDTSKSSKEQRDSHECWHKTDTRAQLHKKNSWFAGYLRSGCRWRGGGSQGGGQDCGRGVCQCVLCHEASRSPRRS